MAPAMPTGTDTAMTAKATMKLFHSARHICWSFHSTSNQRVVVPSQGVTVGNRLVLKVAATMMPRGRKR